MREKPVIERLLASRDPAIRHLCGDERADALASPRVRKLLKFPDAHPYGKCWGTHWRLVTLADLNAPPRTKSLQPGVDRELAWLSSSAHCGKSVAIDGLARRHASQEGNAVYACSRLGFATDPR